VAFRVFRRLRDLVDVDATNIGNGKVPVYRTSSGKHEYETVTGGASAASSVTFTPAGTISSTNVQAAIEEVSGDVGSLSSVYQPLDSDLTAIAGLTSAADKGIQFTGAGTAATFDLTTAGKAILDDADAAAQRTTLGLAIGTNVQAYDAELAALAGLTSAADSAPYFTGSGTAALMTVTSAARTVLDDTTVAAMRTTLGVPAGVLLFDYEITGSDAASIDTAVDGTYATAAFATTYPMLEVFFYGRTDEATTFGSTTIILNNDTSSLYDRISVKGVNATAAASNARAAAAWTQDLAGASHAASFFSTYHLRMPNYGGTVGFKSATCDISAPDSAAASCVVASNGLLYRSTTAISRLKIAAAGAGAQKLKVGSRLIIYGR